MVNQKSYNYSDLSKSKKSVIAYFNLCDTLTNPRTKQPYWTDVQKHIILKYYIEDVNVKDIKDAIGDASDYSVLEDVTKSKMTYYIDKFKRSFWRYEATGLIISDQTDLAFRDTLLYPLDGWTYLLSASGLVFNSDEDIKSFGNRISKVAIAEINREFLRLGMPLVRIEYLPS